MLFGPMRQPLPQVLSFCAIFAVLSSAPGAQAQAPIAADSGLPVNGQAGAAAAAAQSTAPTLPSDAAIGGDQARTRFLIGLGRTVDYQVFSLSNPNRVIVELAETPMLLPTDTGGKPVGLVSTFRAGKSGPDKVRIVIDVTQPVVVESARIEKGKDGKGQRLALQIVPADSITTSKEPKKPFAAPSFGLGAAGLQPPLPMPAVRPDVRAAKAFKPIIVIDPGHGGYDSGAMKNGAIEKDVVLAFSKVLKKKIEAAGRFKVQMTRDTDVFIELGERVAFAERNNANLFIAVHADYADSNSQARGATIYSLRDSVASALQRSAKGDASENVLSKDEVEMVKKASVDGDTGAVAAVKSILADLAGRDLDLTKERTSVFSRSVVDLMGASTHMRNDPAQQAGFRVLKTAHFPSVLIELAYVTNKEDAALLQSDAWREKVADSIMTAVDNYFSNQIARMPM
jgi:N-acetylmuramoyl-L-alanine amidase